MRLVLASRNDHKRRELDQILTAHTLEPLPEEIELPPETGTTFAANALAKARAAATVLGRAAIGEDSGIEAAALGGRPGVRSARYAGPDAGDAENLARLLREVPDGSPAAYRCALAFVDPAAGTERVFEGRCAGRLTTSPRGTEGFGYDPAFVPDEVPGGRTMAELEPAEKDAISHRGRAARQLAGWLAGDPG